MTEVVLGLDLGTLCGWAVEEDGRLHSGAWNLKPARSYDSTRALRLWRHLQDIKEEHGAPKLVAYEEVMSHGRPGSTRKTECPKCSNKFEIRDGGQNILAAHVYGELRGVMKMWCDTFKIRVEGVPVGTLKKFATGSGRADKDKMVWWAKHRWRDQRVTSHDQADALHILDWAMVEKLGRRKRAKLDLRRRPEVTF